MQRGEVWSVSLPFSPGREQSGDRPAIVLQHALYGEGSPLVLTVPITSQVAALRFPAAVEIAPSSTNGLRQPSVAMVFQTRALDRHRFLRRIGVIDVADLSVILTELNRLTGQE